MGVQMCRGGRGIAKRTVFLRRRFFDDLRKTVLFAIDSFAATEVAGAEEVGWNGSAGNRALRVTLFPW